MQKDFHHTIIYVLCRLAGFSKYDSDIISYSSQFVDDNVNDSIIKFTNKAIYDPINSTHKKLDYRNFEELANHLSWVPFHFLPGNCGLEKGSFCSDDYEKRLLCVQNSKIAQDMVEECFKDKDSNKYLYRLGITLHVYADTWAHKGFSGMQSKLNKIKYFKDDIISRKLFKKVVKYFDNIFDNIAGDFICDAMPLGHGAVLTFPDLPYLKWKYKDLDGNLIIRDNPAEYTDAVKKIFNILKRAKEGTDASVDYEIDEENLNKIINLMSKTKSSKAEKRHKVWIYKIKSGHFSFGKEIISYSEIGLNSWKHMALGNEIDNKYKFKDDFLESHWKMFNDALLDHKYFLLRKLFPKYELCIA